MSITAVIPVVAVAEYSWYYKWDGESRRREISYDYHL